MFILVAPSPLPTIFVNVGSMPPPDPLTNDLLIMSAVASIAVALFTGLLALSTTGLAKQTARATEFESLREQRAARPVIVAAVLAIADNNTFRWVHLWNRGDIAFNVTLSGISSDNEPQSSADNFFQVIDSRDAPVKTKVRVGVHKDSYAQKIRIRYFDKFDNKYMTEYEGLSQTLTFPIFRLPWLGRGVGLPRPKRWSEQVTWASEQHETIIGTPEETVDPVDKDK